MQLWTDYEGVTIDGAFPLKKLLLPEGRSAFFSTAGPNGEPTVLRLIECHFDEEEILARWRSVEALHHPNFLKFEHYGQIELDGGPVVYAVFEKVDANLAEVLAQGHLSVKDAIQLACSLVAALDVLHTHGFIHEHIEPRNIFAVNDTVKLRSDCIRETPEGEEGRAAKQREVHDLATVLLQALTQQRTIEGIPAFALPQPFGQIIRNGLDGAWGLDGIRAALESQTGSTLRKTSKPQNGTSPTPRIIPTPSRVEDKAQSVAQQAPSPAANPPETQLPLPLINQDQKNEDESGQGREPKYIGATTHNGTWGEPAEKFSMHQRWLGALGVVALFLLLFTWLLAHEWNAHRHQTSQASSTTQQTSQPTAQSPKQLSTNPVPKSAAAHQPPSTNSSPGWRVISFTYNRRTDAEKKVASLAIAHPDLRPSVFAPTGHAPYLVAIGGVMDRDTAYALARRSRSLGLPHDTYAQNYSH